MVVVVAVVDCGFTVVGVRPCAAVVVVVEDEVDTTVVVVVVVVVVVDVVVVVVTTTGLTTTISGSSETSTVTVPSTTAVPISVTSLPMIAYVFAPALMVLLVIVISIGLPLAVGGTVPSAASHATTSEMT